MDNSEGVTRNQGVAVGVLAMEKERRIAGREVWKRVTRGCEIGGSATRVEVELTENEAKACIASVTVLLWVRERRRAHKSVGVRGTGVTTDLWLIITVQKPREITTSTGLLASSAMESTVEYPTSLNSRSSMEMHQVEGREKESFRSVVWRRMEEPSARRSSGGDGGSRSEEVKIWMSEVWREKEAEAWRSEKSCVRSDEEQLEERRSGSRETITECSGRRRRSVFKKAWCGTSDFTFHSSTGETGEREGLWRSC